MANQTYTLASENEKLEIRARMFDRQSRPFLQPIFSPGQHVFEIGCGMGGATQIIARLLDNTGFITAIDINPEYVDYVQKKLREAGYDNFSIAQQEAEHLSEKNKYDVVYGRAILHHIPDAKKVIRKLLEMLKPGGLMVFEEPIMDTALAQPPDSDFMKIFDWYMQLGKNRGCDYVIGRELTLYFQTLGIDILQSQLIQTIVKNPAEREAFVDMVDTLRNQVIAAKIADNDEINRMRRALEKVIRSNHILYNVQFCQIVGQKKE